MMLSNVYQTLFQCIIIVVILFIYSFSYNQKEDPFSLIASIIRISNSVYLLIHSLSLFPLEDILRGSHLFIDYQEKWFSYAHANLASPSYIDCKVYGEYTYIIKGINFN